MDHFVIRVSISFLNIFFGLGLRLLSKFLDSLVVVTKVEATKLKEESIAMLDETVTRHRKQVVRHKKPYIWSLLSRKRKNEPQRGDRGV